MVLARRFEDEAEREFRRGKIGGYLHVYSGQEAVAAGFLSAIRPDDIFFTAYRDHAHAIFRGAAPGAVMAELFGKATGLAKGKGGSMHLFDVAHGFYGGYGIVGGHIPLATGAAYALRYQKTERICLCFLGDGAMDSGSFHEPANLAGVWGKQGLCPIVYIVENNQYAMGTPVERSSAVTNLAGRFSTYAIDNERADGMDFIEVRRLAERVTRRSRGPGAPHARPWHGLHRGPPAGRACGAPGPRDRRVIRGRVADLSLCRPRRGRSLPALPHEGGDRAGQVA